MSYKCTTTSLPERTQIEYHIDDYHIYSFQLGAYITYNTVKTVKRSGLNF